MRKIIVATDFSENSDSALGYATYLAKQHSAELLVVHTYLPTVSLDSNISYDTIAPSTIQDEMIRSGEKQLNEITESLKGEGVKAESQLIVGGVSLSIVSVAHEINADLIVVGKTPDSSFLDKLFGSTASNVISNTSIPVLIVPPNNSEVSIKTIVYGTELESEEKEVLTKVFTLAKVLHSNVVLIKINADFEMDIQDDEQLLTEIKEHFSEEKFSFSAIKASSVSEGLLGSAHTNNADLLIVARHHHNFLSEIVNPSKSKEIINRTDIPLLVYDIEA